MKIAYTRLEITLMTSFNLYSYLEGDKTKEEAKEAFGIIYNVVDKDVPLGFYLKIILSVLNDVFDSEIEEELLHSNERDDTFIAFEKLLFNRKDGLSDNAILRGVYDQLLYLAFSITGGDSRQVIEAMSNIETIREKLMQRGQL